jgi:hypothetical protein
LEFFMSIAVLTQVYDEARRLAVAGSAVARGDFRLKKLLPALDQAGAKAQVFAKVAESARAVIDGPDESSAANLLELASLVTAVLYTQGETGVAGPLEPIETTDLGAATTQAGARVLKPLMEALTNTGSGRLSLIKDAHDRGAFRDLRLVQPAIDGLDDSYPEIADFLAEQVLPLYGTAILPGLRAKYDPKGGRGDARRLALMHALDPAGTHELVTEALDGGSKEVRVAAVGCLGGSADDLSYLVEQVSAKARDVRAAAYRALASMNDPAAADVLKTAIAGKDIDLAAAAIARSKNENLPDLLIAEVTKARAALPKFKDKAEVSEAVTRLCSLIAALPTDEHAAADALTLDLFARRGELAKVKGADKSGADVIEAVVRRMAEGLEPLRVMLARAHAGLDASTLTVAFRAAYGWLAPEEVYDLFSPYVAAKVSGKSKDKDSAWAKREAIITALGGAGISYWGASVGGPPLDPRWLDLAVRIKHLGLVHAVRRPGHAGALAFALAEYEAVKKSNSQNSIVEAVTVLVRLGHPRATDALIASFEKVAGTATMVANWYCSLIPELPKSAIARLEAVVPTLQDPVACWWLSAIQQLREKD